MKLDLKTELQDVLISLSTDRYDALVNGPGLHVDLVITTPFLSSFTSTL